MGSSYVKLSTNDSLGRVISPQDELTDAVETISL